MPSASGTTIMNFMLRIGLLAGVVIASVACQSTEEAYFSGRDGPVDCANFRIQSSRSDLNPAGEKSCWMSTTNTVEHVATGYGRTFESSSNRMATTLYLAGAKTMMGHREPQSLLGDFKMIKNEAEAWETLPSVRVNDKTYKLMRFALEKRKLSCIGFVNYGDSIAHGYRSINFGFSCMPSQQGIMPQSEILKDLEALHVRI